MAKERETLSFDAFERRIARSRRWVLLGLVALAMVPRIYAAARLDAFCYDGYFYFHVADEFHSGNPEPLLEELNLNLYPVLLAWGRRLGLSWKLTATGLACLLGGLLVLPLYGWVRRLFDEKTALVACLLYAAHPEMIETSVEPIRDGTFWFLLTLWLYCFTRAMREARSEIGGRRSEVRGQRSEVGGQSTVDAPPSPSPPHPLTPSPITPHQSPGPWSLGFGNWAWFLAAGLVFALAVHVRSEGWLLLIIAFGWPLGVFLNKRPERLRVTTGTVAALALTPLLVVAINLTILREQPKFYAGKLQHFAIGWEWLTAKLGSESDTNNASDASRIRQASQPVVSNDTQRPRRPRKTVARKPPRQVTKQTHAGIAPNARSQSNSTSSIRHEAAPPPLNPATASPPRFVVPPVDERAVSFLKDGVETFGYLHLPLLIIGLLCWRRNGWKPYPILAVCLFCLALIAGVWVFYSRYGMTNDRYFLPTVLVLLPIQAGGLFSVAGFVVERFRPVARRSMRRETRAVALACGLLLAVGFVDVATSNHKSRSADYSFARWIESRSTGKPSLVVDRGSRRVGFHVLNDAPRELTSYDDLSEELAGDFPEWLLVMRSKFHLREEAVLHFDGEATKLGYRRLSLSEFPKAKRLYLLYRRRPLRTAASR